MMQLARKGSQGWKIGSGVRTVPRAQCASDPESYSKCRGSSDGESSSATSQRILLDLYNKQARFSV